jgi:hypothetical protein
MARISNVRKLWKVVFRGVLVGSLLTLVPEASFWKNQQPISYFVRCFREVGFAVFRQPLKRCA